MYYIERCKKYIKAAPRDQGLRGCVGSVSGHAGVVCAARKCPRKRCSGHLGTGSHRAHVHVIEPAEAWSRRAASAHVVPRMPRKGLRDPGELWQGEQTSEKRGLGLRPASFSTVRVRHCCRQRNFGKQSARQFRHAATLARRGYRRREKDTASGEPDLRSVQTDTRP